MNDGWMAASTKDRTTLHFLNSGFSNDGRHKLKHQEESADEKWVIMENVHKSSWTYFKRVVLVCQNTFQVFIWSKVGIFPLRSQFSCSETRPQSGLRGRVPAVVPVSA